MLLYLSWCLHINILMKLKKFDAGDIHVKNNDKVVESEKSKLIRYISDRSNRYGDKLIEFMDTYNLVKLQDATEAQLYDFIATHFQSNQKPKEIIKSDEC